ncbi:MAG: hypothetical protein AAF288_13885 [Planctomycetota bacterium]
MTPTSLRSPALVLVMLLSLVCSAPASASPPESGLDRFDAVIFSGHYETPEEFESFANAAKDLGATHVQVTPGLPLAMWQYDTPDDPYPAWMEGQVGLLEIFPPDAIRPHVPEDYSGALVDALGARSRVLRDLGMKGMFTSNSPQIVPEGVLEENPLWRGPRVDQVVRSRVARFALNVDDPEVLALYREAVSSIIEAFPEIDTMSFLTTDSGSGLCWSPGLYPGINGNTLYRDRSLHDRLIGFVHALRDGAKAAGGELDVQIKPIRPQSWMTPSIDFQPELVAKLEKGFAVANREGPDGKPFIVGTGIHWEWNFFYPVVGIEQPVSAARKLSAASESEAPRLMVAMDPWAGDLYPQLFERFWEAPVTDELGRLQLLRSLAAERVGEAQADTLLKVWLAIDDVDKSASVLKIHFPLMTGGVHQRWITRPLVPFPDLLTEEETDYYKPYLFQALDEAHAQNYIDLQATQVYGGWQGKFFVEEITLQASGNIKRARKHLGELQPELTGAMESHYELLDLRLQALDCMLATLRNFASYQGQLDRVKALSIEPAYHPVLGTQSNWDRTLMINTARAELDNTAVLIDILQKANGPVLHTAETPEGERIRLLSSDLIPQLQMKLKTMNARWNDYDAIFTRPNP